MAAADSFPSCPLWDFSVAAYVRPGVAPACLALQQRWAVDVNLLLYCCWLGESGRGVIDGGGLARARDAVAPWHEHVVKGLRAVRNRLKVTTDKMPPERVVGLRKMVLAAELDAEHVEQLALFAQAPASDNAAAPVTQRIGDGARNALTYLASLGVAADDEDRGNLAKILNGAFPNAEPEWIEAALIGQFDK